MIHTSLYTLTPGGAVTDSDMPAVTDPAVSIVNNHPIFPVPIKLELAYLLGNAQSRYAKIVTPKLQATALPTIRPIDNNTTPQTRPPVDNYYKNPLSLNPIEENAVQLTVAAGAQVANYAALWFTDGMRNVPPGDVFTVHATASLVIATGAWGGGAFILDRPLPAGTYAVVGFDIWGANLLFARLVFPGQSWRPGVIAGTTAGFINCPAFRFGGLGEMGRFASYSQPSVELFTSANSVTQDLFLDVVRVG